MVCVITTTQEGYKTFVRSYYGIESNICQHLINISNLFRLVDDDEGEEENDVMLEQIRKVQQDLEHENQTEREIDLGDIYSDKEIKKLYMDKTINFCKQTEN